MNSSTTAEDSPSAAFSKKNSGVEEKIDNDRSKIGCSDGDDNVNLQDSEFTVETNTNEPIPGAGWFGGIGTDFLHCLTENVSPVVSGVATLVHNTAVAVANEISQLEREGELLAAAMEAANKDDGRQEKGAISSALLCESSSFDSNSKRRSENLTLPWEVCREASHNPTVQGEDGIIPVYFTDKELMKKIFALSKHDSTFLEPFSESSAEVNQLLKQQSRWSTFVMDDHRIKLIKRILDIDENLASAHSRLAGDPNFCEINFWKNYFFHCERVRTEEFRRRKNENETTDAELEPFTGAKMANFGDNFLTNEDTNSKTSKDNDDEESLVPVGSDVENEQEEDSSFVIPSAPNTGDTYATSRSIDDDLVLVDVHERLFSEK